MAKYIPLPTGQQAIVDDADYEWLSQWSWFLVKKRYAGRMENRKVILMHRAIMNAESTIQVDHCNNDGLDNRRSNLRLATATEQRHNSPKPGSRIGKSATSQYKGVYRPAAARNPNNRWTAYITVNKKHLYLGAFATEHEAAIAYDDAAREHFGSFAYTNF